MPQILKNMGFTSTKAQLMTAPPYACGAISALLSSLLADKFTWRMPFIVSSQLLLIIAFSILFALAGASLLEVSMLFDDSGVFDPVLLLPLATLLVGEPLGTEAPTRPEPLEQGAAVPALVRTRG